MAQRIPGFRGEYLWELEIPEKQITAVAEAIPADKYSWRPADRARSVSEVLVHIAVGNFLLLDVVGVPLPADLYGQIEGEGYQRMLAVIRKNDGFERAITAKADVVQLLSDPWRRLKRPSPARAMKNWRGPASFSARRQRPGAFTFGCSCT